MKVRISNAKADKHYKHPLAHDVSTSAEWGHMQPLMVREIIGNSKNTLRMGQIVRMMPLNFPTFGRISYNTYNVFVPIESVYHPWGSFRAGQTYMGANATYIPNKVITTNCGFWSFVCKCMSTVSLLTVYSVAASGDQISFERPDPVYIQENPSVYSRVMSEWVQSYYSYLPGQFFAQSGLYDYRSSDNSAPADQISFARYDWIDYFVDSEDQGYLVCGRYHESARALRKVLYGCGYKLINDYEDISMLPLLAYYKAYFDLFYPKRSKTWKDTPAAGLQEWCEQNGNFDACKDSGFAGQKINLMFQFIVDLCQTYYTQSPDFVSAHITGQRISNVDNESFKVLSNLNNTPYVGTLAGQNTGVGIGSGVNSEGGVTSYSQFAGSYLSPQNLDILQRIYRRINAKTAIGADIRAFLKTQLGTDYLEEDESYWIGSQKLELTIVPVFSNAETEEAYVGEFRGQGYGGTKGEDNVLTYEAKVHGFWVTMAAIVPDSRFAQGVDMNLKHVKRTDYYDSIYDSMTLLPTAKKFIFAEKQLSLAAQDVGMSDSFGNIPNYMEYCTTQNVVNGDMSLMSKRNKFLPFTLDKLLPYTGVYSQTVAGASVPTYHISNTPNSVIVNGDLWRYIGLYKWIGNYDRVFRESGTQQGTVASLSQFANSRFYSIGFDDNFICHNYLDLQCWNAKLPVSDAFQTGAFEDSAIKVEKA